MYWNALWQQCSLRRFHVSKKEDIFHIKKNKTYKHWAQLDLYSSVQLQTWHRAWQIIMSSVSLSLLFTRRMWKLTKSRAFMIMVLTSESKKKTLNIRVTDWMFLKYVAACMYTYMKSTRHVSNSTKIIFTDSVSLYRGISCMRDKYRKHFVWWIFRHLHYIHTMNATLMVFEYYFEG